MLFARVEVKEALDEKDKEKNKHTQYPDYSGKAILDVLQLTSMTAWQQASETRHCRQ